MKFNYVQILCDLGYKLIKDDKMKTLWFQKKIGSHTLKDIIIDFRNKTVNCEINYYNQSGDLFRKEGTMTFEEFKIINFILEDDDIFNDDIEDDISDIFNF